MSTFDMFYIIAAMGVAITIPVVYYIRKKNLKAKFELINRGR